MFFSSQKLFSAPNHSIDEDAPLPSTRKKTIFIRYASALVFTLPLQSRLCHTPPPHGDLVLSASATAQTLARKSRRPAFRLLAQPFSDLSDPFPNCLWPIFGRSRTTYAQLGTWRIRKLGFCEQTRHQHKLEANVATHFPYFLLAPSFIFRIRIPDICSKHVCEYSLFHRTRMQYTLDNAASTSISHVSYLHTSIHTPALEWHFSYFPKFRGRAEASAAFRASDLCIVFLLHHLSLCLCSVNSGLPCTLLAFPLRSSRTCFCFLRKFCLRAGA